jgi:hypothetical protein
VDILPAGGNAAPGGRLNLGDGFDMLGKVLIKVLSDKPKNFGCEERFKVNPLTQFIANNIDRYERLTSPSPRARRDVRMGGGWAKR